MPFGRRFLFEPLLRISSKRRAYRLKMTVWVRMIGAKTQPGFVRGVDIRKIEEVKFRAKGKRNIEANNFSNLKNDEQIKT